MTKWLLRSTALLSLGTFVSAIVVVFLLAPLVQAASEGPNAPDTCVNDNSYGTGVWTNLSNALTDDGSGAAAFFNTGTSQYLKCTDYDFTIPTGATIDGIVVGIDRLSSNGFFECADDRVLLVKSDGTLGSTNKATATTWPTSYAYEDHGGSTDLWGETWTSTDINDVDFGVALSALRIDSTCGANVDHIRITVHYTEGSTPAVQTREAQVIWW